MFYICIFWLFYHWIIYMYILSFFGSFFLSYFFVHIFSFLLAFFDCGFFNFSVAYLFIVCVFLCLFCFVILFSFPPMNGTFGILFIMILYDIFSILNLCCYNYLLLPLSAKQSPLKHWQTHFKLCTQFC